MPLWCRWIVGVGLLLSGCGESHYEPEQILSEAKAAVEAGAYFKAAAWLEQVEPGQPQPQSYYLIKGITHFKLREFERAATALEAAKPESAALMANLAYLYLFLGNIEQANTLAAEIAFRHPEHLDKYAEWFLLIGNIRLREQKYMASRIAFTQALALSGDASRAYVGLANVAFFERDFSQTEEQFLKAVFHAPRNVYAYVALSKYYLAMKRYNDAEAMLHLVLTFDAEDINVVILLSNVLIKSKQYHKALNLLKQYESNLPYSHVVKSQIVRCLLFLKKYDEAYQVISSLDSQYRDDILTLTGEYYLRTNQIDLALADFHGAVASHDDYLENYYLGLTYLLEQDNGLALKYLNDATRQYPPFLKAHLLLAALYVRNGDYAAALKRCHWVIRLDPQNLQAHLLRGMTMYLQHRLTEASAVFHLVSAWAPTHPVPPFFIALIARQKKRGARPGDLAGLVTQIQAGYIEALFLDLDGAKAPSEAFWASYLEQNSNEQVLLLIASYYQEHGQLDRAVTYLNRAIALNAACALCYYQLAHVESLRGEKEAATESLVQTLELDDRLLEAYQALGVLYEQQNEYLKAATIYEKGLLFYPKDPMLLNNLGWIQLIEFKDATAAYIHIRKAVSIAPGDPDIRDTQAWWYVLNHEEGRAIRILKPLIEANPAKAIYRYHVGMAYLQSGREQAGAEQLRLALRYGIEEHLAAHIRQVLQ